MSVVAVLRFDSWLLEKASAIIEANFSELRIGPAIWKERSFIPMGNLEKALKLVD